MFYRFYSFDTRPTREMDCNRDSLSVVHENLFDDTDDACEEEEDIEAGTVQTVLINQNGGSTPSSPSLSSQDGALGSESQHHHAVKQWSYEEQFRQVHNIVQSLKHFLLDNSTALQLI